MAYALVGTIGAVSLGAANTAVTPAWGTSENRTAKNLLVCWVAVHATATLPTTPGGWSIGVQKAGTSMSVTAYYKVATGADSAPQIGAMGANTFIQAQLAEFSGGADGAPVANAGVGTAGLTSPIVATLGAIDPTTGTLVVVVGASFYSAAATKTLTHTVTGGATVITASQNNATSLARHYAFGRGPTTTNAGADSDSFAQTTTSITGGAVGIVSFLLGPPVTSAPTAASMTLTGATPVVSAAQTYVPSAAAMTLTGATPTVSTPVVSLPTAASMTLTGATPTVTTTANVTSVPTAASMTLTGATPVVSAPAVSVPTAAAMTLAGATPTVAAAQTYAPSAASMTLAGAAPIVSAAQTYAPSAASMILAGATPAVSLPITSAPSAGTLTLTGSTPDVTLPIVSLPSAASFTLTGFVPDIALPISVVPSPASMTFSGAVPTVTIGSGGAPIVSVPTAGTLTLAGGIPQVSTPIVSIPIAASLALAGATPSVAVSANVTAQPSPAILTLIGAGGVVPLIAWGGPGLRVQPQGPTPEEAKRERERKRRQRREEQRVARAIAAAMIELEDQRRHREEDWLLGLVTDETYTGGV